MSNATVNFTPADLAAIVDAAPAKETVAKRAKRVSIRFDLNKRQVAAVKRFIRFRDAEKKAEASKKAAEEEIRGFIGNANALYFEGMKVMSVVESSRSSNDPKLLMEAYPEAYAKTRRVTLYTFLKTA